MMTPSVFFRRSTGSLLKGLALLLAFAPGAFSQGAAEGPSPDEFLASLDTGLKGVNDREEDKKSEAIELVRSSIDSLLSGYTSYDASQQRKVAEEITGVFSLRLKKGEEDTEGQQVYYAAAAALSEMGEMGEAGLKKAMKVKSISKMVEVQAMLIEALGKHKNEKNIDMFAKLLVNSEPKLAKAAILSLSEYRDSEAKVRKEITEELVKQYATTHNADLKAKGNDATSRERLLMLEVPLNEALAMLTLQSFQSAPEWESWYNDNRNKKW